MTPEPDTVVGEKYRIVRPLGVGGMGTVYEAVNLLTLKRAAIKWLHPRLLAPETAAKRLLLEARATSRIRHRNVVDVYDVLQQQDSVFLVMELLIGEPLAAHVERNSALDLAQLVSLLLPAMRGVEAAHAVGVVHRDIKPDNIFLAQEAGSDAPVPKIIDFGISRVFAGSDQERLTRSGMTMGTPRYVSYEQLRGERDVDVRADVYAFGVILYESLVGEPPYSGTTLSEQAIRFATTCARAPHEIRPELPVALSQLVMAAIEKERDRRVATVSELLARLEPFSRATAYPQALRAFPPRANGRAHARHDHSSVLSTVDAPCSTMDGPRATEGAASLPGLPRRQRPSLRLAVIGLVAGGLLGWTILRTEQRAISVGRSGTPAAERGPPVLDAIPVRAAAPIVPDVASAPHALPLAAKPEGDDAGSDAQGAEPLEADAAAVQPDVAGRGARRTRTAPPASPARSSQVDEPTAPQPPPLRAGGMSKHEF